MKLSVAIAVLMLVFAAHTEAAEETIEQKFATFTNQMKEVTDGLVEKTKTAFDQIHTSEFGAATRNWFTEQFAKLKQTVEETFPKTQ